VKGVVFGSVAGTVAMATAQAVALRRELHGIEGGRILSATIRILIATAALAGVSYGVWYGLDQALGRSLVGQIVSLGGGIIVGIAVYIAAVLALRVEEARQIRRLIGGRLGRGRAS
jgi:putative peptidoglycan lipid II flippase